MKRMIGQRLGGRFEPNDSAGDGAGFAGERDGGHEWEASDGEWARSVLAAAGAFIKPVFISDISFRSRLFRLHGRGL
jgi:hypothetical protein